MARPQPPQHRPKRNASRQEWYLYAANRCRYTDAMETMSRADLIALVEREAQAQASFRISSIGQQPARFACGCVVGGPVNCYPTPGRAPEGVVTVHGTPMPEVHDDPWPDVDDEVVHEQISGAVGRGMFTDQVRKLLEGKAAEIETVANGGRTKCPSCGMAYRNSLGHPAHCPPIGREIVEHLPEQIRPFSVRDAIQEHVMQGSPQHPAGQHPVDVFLNAAWTWLRDNIVAVWATILVIGAIVMVGANPAVGAVSIGIAAAVVLPIAIPLHRRHRRRQLLERMAQQHDLWMTDPVEYRRRVEEGEL